LSRASFNKKLFFGSNKGKDLSRKVILTNKKAYGIVNLFPYAFCSFIRATRGTFWEPCRINKKPSSELVPDLIMANKIYYILSKKSRKKRHKRDLGA
jgi:hypothetical protein